MSTEPDTAARRVTVLVVARDDGPFVAAAVQSALAQERCTVEVLVLDDGSSDEGPAALARLADPRVRVVCQPQRGVARALNLGLALARTRGVVLLTGRDTLLPGCIAAQLDASEARPAPPAAVLVGARRHDPSGAPLADDGRGDRAGAAAEPAATRAALVARLLAAEDPSAAGALVERDVVLRAGGFAPTLALAAYRDLWLRLLALGHDVVELPERLVQTTVRPAVGAAHRARETAEHAYVLHRALAGRGLDDVAALLRDGTGPGDDRARTLREVARLVRHAGGAEVRGLAAEVDSRAAAAPRTPPRGAPAVHDDGALRVALEVATLDRGGLETVVHDLALGLRDAGLVPLVVCTGSGGVRADALERAGVAVAVLDPRDPEADLARLLAAHDVQLLNAHFSTFGTHVAARLGIPVVATLHNAYAWVGSGVLEEFRVADALVDGYVAVSQSVADFCARRFALTPERIVVLRNSVDAVALASAARDRSAARRALGVPDDVRLLVQVGRVDPIKCQLATVEAVRALAAARPELRAWLVGGVGDPAYAHRVRARIREAGLEGRVALLGERDDVPAILAAADAFVMPSVLEGLSLAAIEAMAAGLPAVLTRTGDAAFLLGEDETDGDVLPGALVDGPSFGPWVDSAALNALAASDAPPHAAPLAAALADVLDDLPRRSALARARAATLAHTLSREEWVRRHVELFEAVAAAGAACRSRALARAAAERTAAAERERDASAALRDGAEALSRALLAHAGAGRTAALLQRARWDVEAARGSFVETSGILERALDKLRLGHRVRTALEDLRRRARGGPGR